jgi:hypothetical protein
MVGKPRLSIKKPRAPRPRVKKEEVATVLPPEVVRTRAQKAIYLNIDPDAHDNLRILAMENNRSMSNLMEWILLHPKLRAFLRNDLRSISKAMRTAGFDPIEE